MKLYLNNVTDMPKKVCELDEQIIAMSGRDRPKFIDPRTGVAGDLGFDTWIDHWYKPTAGASIDVAGTLNKDKYYSLVAVPVDRNLAYYGSFQTGTPTMPSIPSKPVEHVVVDETGSTASANGTTTLTDITASWSVDEWVGYTVYNTTAATSGTVVSNTTTILTLDTDLGTTSGDSYEIIHSTYGLRFTIKAHPQNMTHECGTSTTETSGTITDASKEWIVDEWIGYECIDVVTGLSGTITDSSATTLTVSGLSIPVGNGFQIVSSKATHRLVYACEMTNEDDLSASTFIYHGSVDGNDEATFDLLAYATSGESVPYSYIPPENLSYCISEDNKIFATGGVSESRGKCHAEITEETVQATASADSAITVSLVTEDYQSSGTGRIMRFMIGSALTPPTNMFIGSYVTITSSSDSGNDIEDARILRKADDNTWFEIESNTGVAATDTGMLATIFPNAIIGNESGDDQTYFRQGMLYATIRIGSDAAHTIGWVDNYSQTMTLSEKYNGVEDVDATFSIDSSYAVYWSDYGNPHVWRTENSVQIADEPVALEIVGGLLLVFCKRSIWKIPMANLYQTPSRISSSVKFSAPFSLVRTPQGIMFHDGTGFSITDGQSVVSVTQYRATDYMSGMNPAMYSNIRGVYDSVNKRVEYVFAYGMDITNNNGMYITTDSLNVYPFIRLDCNAVWEGEDDTGRPVVMHGTSGRHVASGGGTVYSHPEDQPLDGATSPSAVVTSVGSGYLVVQATEALTAVEGSIALHHPDGAGYIIPFIVESITDNGSFSYDIGFSDDWYHIGFEEGATILFGMIPFDYGTKWMDFASPQYQHKVRQVQMDIEGFTGVINIDHYGDLSDVPIHRSSYEVDATTTKLIVPLKKGSYYTYGFRIRGYSSTTGRIMSIEVLFDTEI